MSGGIYASMVSAGVVGWRVVLTTMYAAVSLRTCQTLQDLELNVYACTMALMIDAAVKLEVRSRSGQ